AKGRLLALRTRGARRRVPGARPFSFPSGGARGWVSVQFDNLDRVRVPRGFGASSAALILGASLAFGIVRGGHAPAVIDWSEDVRDMAANAAGFNISGVALSGQKHLTREEIFAIAGITGRTSLLFLDVADARARLKANPWIADATVQKLYPDRLQITIV